MPFFNRTYQENLGDCLEDLSVGTNISRLSPGGKARAILESVNKRLDEAFDIFDLNLARAFVSSAPGQFLDLIGALLGVDRQPSVSAGVDADMQVLQWYVDEGTFGNLNSSAQMIIPSGTVISTQANNGGITYRTTEQVILPPSGSSAFFAAEAVIPGEASNVGTNQLVHHSFTGYTDYLNNTLLVRNIHQIASGKNIESDANYRFRIANQALAAEAANRTAIRLACLSTPGVADVSLIPRYKGIGTFGCVIKSVTPTVSQNLIDSVTANVYRVQNLGSVAFIRGPKETGIVLRTTIYYARRLPSDQLDDIEENLREVITDSVNSLDHGDPLLIDRLSSELFAISDEIQNLGEVDKPFEEIYIYKNSKLEDNKVRGALLGDYYPETDERVIIEPSVANPITFTRSFTRRQ